MGRTAGALPLIAAFPDTPSLNPYQTPQGRAHLPHFTEEERKALENEPPVP